MAAQPACVQGRAVTELVAREPSERIAIHTMTKASVTGEFAEARSARRRTGPWSNASVHLCPVESGAVVTNEAIEASARALNG